MTTKPTETWTEDEQKIAKEYEKKQAALLEEREKHRLVRTLISRSKIIYVLAGVGSGIKETADVDN